jgi:threonylcarbamoyladenosine tRNA methylthiotransferase MtaB
MKVAIYTLGCKVNSYESEYVISLFKNKGYEIVTFNEYADIYIINTCTVTNTADIKSKKIIKQAINKNKDAIIVAMGCYVQAKYNDVKSIEDIDIIIGNKDKSKIVEYIEEYINNKQRLAKLYEIDNVEFEQMQINHFDNKKRALVKIQDGCNNFCSYCIIPYVRGRVRSRGKEDILNEINELINTNHFEIILVGIHIGQYGLDFDNYNFNNLLQDILKIKGLKRLRISSIEITELNDDVLQTIKNNDIIVDHLHIPLQSGSDKILNLMNRKYDTKYFLDKINYIRSIRSNISITTDVIVGFPNETDQDYNDSINFIKQINFSKVHVFPYSKRDNTKAALMDNHIDENIKKQRAKDLLLISKQLEQNYMNKFIDKSLEIIPESYIDGYLIGHSSNYLTIKVKGNKDLLGQVINVKIIKEQYPYLIGEILK